MNKESVSNLVGTNALYGRARRIEFVERAAYIFVGIIAVILVFVLVRKTSATNETNVNFSYLREYLENRGFSCEVIYRSGGVCVYNTDAVSSSFVRYDDGFQYITKTDGYMLDMVHSESKGEYITLRTTAYALNGYKNKIYYCSFDGSVLGELEYCEDESKTRLDSETYISLINKAIHDMNNVIDSSGYNRDKLVKKYEWVKK